MVNIFYVAGDGNGFTDDPAWAMKDLTGTPIIAPGHLRNMARKIGKREANAMLDKRLETVWEYVLDMMETVVEHEQVPKEHLNPKWIDMRNSEIYGMCMTLAMLEYEHDWQTDWESALNRVQAEAQARYERSAGD